MENPRLYFGKLGFSSNDEDGHSLCSFRFEDGKALYLREVASVECS